MLIMESFAWWIRRASFLSRLPLPVKLSTRLSQKICASMSIVSWDGFAKYRKSLCLADVKQAPWSDVYHPLYRDLEMRSELAVPLVSASGRLEGVLNLESPRIGAFSEADSHLLHAFATQATIAIQEVKLLESLKEISETILQEGLIPVLDHIVSKVIELVNAADCGIWLLDHQNLILGAGTERVQSLGVLPAQEAIILNAMSNDRIIPIDSMEQIEPWWPEGQLRPVEWSHGLVFPLSGGDGQHQHTSGVLCVFYARSEVTRFTISSWDEKVISILAHYAVLALQNRDSIEAVQNAQNQTTLVETFAALGDVAANLLHQLNNKFGTIPVRVQGLQERYADLLEQEPYLKKNLTAIEESARQAIGNYAGKFAFTASHPKTIGHLGRLFG